MPLFDDPVGLERAVQQLYLASEDFEHRLGQGEIDYQGPFTHKPRVTTREAFREIRDLPLPQYLKTAWLKWAFRLTDARVNASFRASIAERYRIEKHHVEWHTPLDLTLQELLERAMRTSGMRDFFFNAFAEAASNLGELELALWTRRIELAQRAEFSGLDEIESPTSNAETIAEQFLRATDDLLQALVPRHLEGFFDCAMAMGAREGWPTKIHPHAIRQLLCLDDWFSSVSLRIKALPKAYSAASFCRALSMVGIALVDAHGQGQPSFVAGNDPNGLRRHQMGALLGSLPQNPIYLRRALRLSPHESARQSRLISVSLLLHSRTAALKVLLRHKLLRNRREFLAEYEALCHRAFGCPIPGNLAGVFPRLHIDSAARFLGTALASRLNDDLTASFDEDWFRNPRAVEALSDRLSSAPDTSLEQGAAEQQVAELAHQLAARLS